MLKQISDRSKKMKRKILDEAERLFGNVNTHIFYQDNGWWVKIFIGRLNNGEKDIIEYDVLSREDGRIEFVIRNK